MGHTVSNPPENVVAIIPARYSSTRFPGKVLAEITGRPMVLHVVERALAARNVGRVIVATDDQRVFDAVASAGYEVTMTSVDHVSGSDRIAEVAECLHDIDLIVNVQGDEPMISSATIDRAIEALLNSSEAMVATTSEAIMDARDVLSPDVVKVVTDGDGRALYFSRSPIPFPRNAVNRHGSLTAALSNEPALLKRFRKHTGLYVYRREFLLEYTKWPPSRLERAESLEQLRAVERGVLIKVIEVTEPSIGIDTPADLERLAAQLDGNNDG